MKKIKNVYNGESAFIVGELVACGCQLLRADELDEAAKRYNVDNSKLKEIKDALGSETNWNEALTHESPNVRKEVAKRGVGLDTLVKDKYWMVRAEVARHGFGLDILVNDEDSDVRREVAKQGYGLDILVNDLSSLVRMEVAEQGFGLETLVSDPSWLVRFEVARQGFGLDILVNDEDHTVRREAEKQLKMLTNV